MSSGTTREDTGGGRSSADQGERPQEEPACPHQDLALPAPVGAPLLGGPCPMVQGHEVERPG